MKAGDAEKAIQLYSEAIKCDPENAALFSNRSAAYCKASKYMEARTDAETAVQLKPDWSKVKKIHVYLTIFYKLLLQQYCTRIFFLSRFCSVTTRRHINKAFIFCHYVVQAPE